MSARANPAPHPLGSILVHNRRMKSNPSMKVLARSARTSWCTIVCLLSVNLIGFGQALTQPHSTAQFDELSRRAAIARENDHLDKAASLYRKALSLHPKWAGGWFSLATIEYDLNDYKSAARDFQRVAPLAPRDGTALAMLGLCQFELKQDVEALKNLRAGLSLGVATDQQLQPVVLYHEGVLLLRGGQFKAASNALGLLCKLGIRSDESMEAIGMAVLRKSPAQSNPMSAANTAFIQRIGIAACLSTLKKFPESNEAYATLLGENPDFPNIRYAYGLSLVQQNDIPKAVEQFKKVIEHDPNNVEARLEIAAALYKVDSAAALPYAQQAASLNPQQPFAHYLLGLLLLDTNEFSKAIPELEIAAKSFPNEKRVFFALGSAYARAGRRQEAASARAAFERLNKQPLSDSQATY